MTAEQAADLVAPPLYVSVTAGYWSVDRPRRGTPPASPPGQPVPMPPPAPPRPYTAPGTPR